MQTKQSEQENLQNSTETEANMNSRFDVEMEIIEDTIFSIANNPAYGWFLLIGRNRVTDIYKTREEALKVIEVIPAKTWDIIFKMVCIASEAAYKVDREENKG